MSMQHSLKIEKLKTILDKQRKSKRLNLRRYNTIGRKVDPRKTKNLCLNKWTSLQGIYASENNNKYSNQNKIPTKII